MIVDKLDMQKRHFFFRNVQKKLNKKNFKKTIYLILENIHKKIMCVYLSIVGKTDSSRRRDNCRKSEIFLYSLAALKELSKFEIASSNSTCVKYLLYTIFSCVIIFCVLRKKKE